MFGPAAAMPLLKPTNVRKLINAPKGCAEQTMIMMSPTALAIRYMDSHNHWLELEPEMRDKALTYIEQGEHMANTLITMHGGNCHFSGSKT